ncbi:hypothetical protein [Emticicia sp. TH156]|uniref:hypothetical protein n=1 Tax=Emticicia sp. TH156 TaxID=2067454 RepID=UPI000C7829BF|nr:hypothetical protein [Emticicia sp. TH156]PLK44208.1 hypothetical protein C0V77_10425 [Emticicia sp. TH156]
MTSVGWIFFDTYIYSGKVDKIDKPTSKEFGIPIYAIDSYSGKKTDGVGTIHRVTSGGKQTNFVGKTIGKGTTTSFNIGLDALQRSSGKIK